MKEAGNYFEHIVKDHGRFENDQEYRNGWLAGEAEGIKIQQEANALAGAAGAANMKKYYKPNTKAIGADAMKGVDTSTWKNLK